MGHLNVPDPLPVIDGPLAATARAQGLILITRKVGTAGGIQSPVIRAKGGYSRVIRGSLRAVQHPLWTGL